MGTHNKKISTPAKFHIKKGDQVKVIAGKDKGKEGEVLVVYPKKYRVLVDGVNAAKKHTKPTENNPGGINDINLPIHISNVMLIDPKSGEPTKTGRKEVDGKVVRYAKKSGEVIS